MHNREQVLHQFLLWGECVAVHNHQVRALPRTERGKPLKPKADQPILVRDDEPLHPPQFNLFHEAIELFALIVETAAHSLYPLINVNLLSLAIGPQGSLVRLTQPNAGWPHREPVGKPAVRPTLAAIGPTPAGWKTD